MSTEQNKCRGAELDQNKYLLVSLAGAVLELEFLELARHRVKIMSGIYFCRNLRDTDVR